MEREKATSDLLIGPDWTMNIVFVILSIQIVAFRNNGENCGDYVHFQIAEKNILGEMVKIVKKKTNMHVRDKILVLLDSWQEAFGGPRGKHPQYYWACEELRRAGVVFPQRSLDAAPIFTPPVAHSTLRHAQVGRGMPSNSSRRLDETMATEFEGLSLSGLDSMRNVMELLNDMLQAVNPDDREALKDEIIVDLVNRCRSNQKKLMQMLTTTGDEELLDRGLELNDSLQILLAKHDAIASGSLMPTQVNNLGAKPSEGSSNIISTEVKGSCPSSSANATVSVANVTRSPIAEEDEEEDDFAQLARRHSKTQSSPSQSKCGTSMALVPVDTNNAASSTTTVSTPTPQQLQSKYPQYSSGYPPPPWAATTGYANGQSHMSATTNMFSTPQANTTTSYAPSQAARPMQHYNSFTPRGSNGLAMNGDPIVNSGLGTLHLQDRSPLFPHTDYLKI
ncbi:hypothetical protein GH714_003148 [Hevea brasiliensis]|uniref:VHS domain-containing protein n=1 Tax=Hevea brasiliensis TaxID=3981 RepID=A0A6A6LUT7_HEVBR|nr:hypothetical protein GH714_003148 [Hevea brasiliensis]